MNDGVTLEVRVVPRASRTEIAGLHDGALRVRLAAPPVDNAANDELVKFLAKTFSVAKSDVEIVSGQTSRSKRVHITGIARSEVEAVLNAKT
jgi:uncharacterized protein (TIGR00251 family)